MNDEIKEINIKIPGQILDYVDTNEHLLDLFNYITNLQQENEKLLNENIVIKDVKYIVKETIYKSRCEKAIEYINKNKHLSMFADCRESEEDWNYDLECSANDLLNILQNGSDDNE